MIASRGTSELFSLRVQQLNQSTNPSDIGLEPIGALDPGNIQVAVCLG